MPHSSATFPASFTGKPLYTIYAVTVTLLTFPYYLLTYILPSLRPHPKWTYRQSVMNHLMYAFLRHASIVEMQTPLPLSPASQGPQNFAVIPPAQEPLYQGVLTPTKEISPGSIGGVWYPSPYNQETDSESTIFLYFHGGAFVIGTALPDVCGFAATVLTSAFAKSKVLAFSYRLSSKNASNAFPAALQDSLSAYIYLLFQGIPARRIVLAADSAGCNLAIGLLRYLASPHCKELKLQEPMAAVLCSPWVDVYATRAPLASFASRYHRTATDYVPPELQLWGARTYIPATTNAEIDTYISPHHHPFHTSTRLWILISGGEVLAQEGAEWAREMRGVGCQERMEMVEGANHAVLGVGGMMGSKKEVDWAVKKGMGWILGLEGVDYKAT